MATILDSPDTEYFHHHRTFYHTALVERYLRAASFHPIRYQHRAGGQSLLTTELRDCQAKCDHTHVCFVLVFFFFLGDRYHYVAQAGIEWLFTGTIIAHYSLNLLDSSDPLASADLIF